MASRRPSIPISSTVITHPSPSGTIPVVRFWVEIAFARQAEPLFFRRSLLDTGAPLSVIPYSIHHPRKLAWEGLTGPWPPGFTTWYGVPCVVGAIEVWFPTPQPPFLRGPFRLIAKFAQATPPSIPTGFPILLGLNFLVDHRSEVRLQCHTEPCEGSILLP